MSGLRLHRLRIGTRSVALIEGPFGWGECSPLHGYSCSPSAAMAAAIEAAEHPWPKPVREAVPANALVADASFDPGALVGFDCVKVKVGRNDPSSDLALVAAVRDTLGPSVKLRVDANGSWDEDSAERVLERMARYDIELAEQPVRSIDAMARVRRRVSVRLAADECVRSIEDAKLLRRLGAADALVLKVQPLGGVSQSLRIAEAANVPVLVSSMMETSVGIAVALNLAASLPELPFACGLATAGALGADVVGDPLVANGGQMEVRRVVPDRDLLAALAYAAGDSVDCYEAGS